MQGKNSNEWSGYIRVDNTNRIKNTNKWRGWEVNKQKMNAVVPRIITFGEEYHGRKVVRDEMQ